MSAIYDANFYYYNKRELNSIYGSVLGGMWLIKDFKILENIYGKRFMNFRYYYYQGRKDDPNAQTEEYWVEID